MKTAISALTILSLFVLIGCGSQEPTGVPPTAATGTTTGGTAPSTPTEPVAGGTEVTEAELEMPFYPGATIKAGSAFEVVTPTEENYNVVYMTADEPSKVEAFYKEKFADASFGPLNTAEKEGFLMSKTLASGKKIALTALRTKGSAETEVTLSAGMVKSEGTATEPAPPTENEANH